MTDDDLKKAAIEHMRTKEVQDKLISDYANIDYILPSRNPYCILMAGAPGAGKTEFSIRFIKNTKSIRDVVRIDPDEIRKLIPQ